MLLVYLMQVTSNVLAQQPVKVPAVTEPAVELDPLIAKLLKEDPKDDELRKLMKARCVALAELRKDLEARLGRIPTEDYTTQVTDLNLTTQRYLQGCLELTEIHEDKLAVLALFVQIAKDFEAKTKERVSQGVGPPIFLTRARCNRMDMEVQLLRAKKEVDIGKSSGFYLSVTAKGEPTGVSRRCMTSAAPTAHAVGSLR